MRPGFESGAFGSSRLTETTSGTLSPVTSPTEILAPDPYSWKAPRVPVPVPSSTDASNWQVLEQNSFAVTTSSFPSPFMSARMTWFGLFALDTG